MVRIGGAAGVAHASGEHVSHAHIAGCGGAAVAIVNVPECAPAAALLPGNRSAFLRLEALESLVDPDIRVADAVAIEVVLGFPEAIGAGGAATVRPQRARIDRRHRL